MDLSTLVLMEALKTIEARVLEPICVDVPYASYGVRQARNIALKI